MVFLFYVLYDRLIKRKGYSAMKKIFTIVLPLCMGGCTYCRLNQKKFCIPEKYFLDKYIKKLYTEATTKSGRGDFK